MKRSFIAFCNGDSVRKLDSLVVRDERLALEPFEGQKVVVTIENWSRKKTLPQNAYLHWAFKQVADYIHEDERIFKQAIMERLGVKEEMTDADGEPICDDNGEIMYSVKSIRDYTVEEMTSLIDRFRHWAMTYLNFVVPEADKYRQYNIK